MSESTLHVEAGDGASLELTLFRAPDDAAAPVFVCLPAMGVAASYYAPLAEALRGQGFHAVTADLRGIGTSSVRAGRRVDFGYHKMVEFDLPAIVTAVRDELPRSRIFLLGHSLGGQLACLFAATRPEAVSGLVLIASCSVYHRGWRFPGNLVLLGFQQLARLAALVLGHFPGGGLGFGGREARRLMGDWARQGLIGRYRVAESERDFEALLARLELPLLAISFTDDPYCLLPGRLLGLAAAALGEPRRQLRVAGVAGGDEGGATGVVVGGADGDQAFPASASDSPEGLVVWRRRRTHPMQRGRCITAESLPAGVVFSSTQICP